MISNRIKSAKVSISCLAVIAAAFVTSPAYGKVHCEKAKVERVYNTSDKVYVHLRGLSWHVLGFKGDADLNQKIAIIQEAERGNHYITLTFPQGYDDSCMVMDDTVAVEKVKLKKRKARD